MNDALEKELAIQQVLDRLWAKLGRDKFVIVDHWENDLCAVGIASPFDHRVLAYLSTYGESMEHYYVELELPPPPGDAFPYQFAGSFNGLTFEQLVDVVANHLAHAQTIAVDGNQSKTL